MRRGVLGMMRGWLWEYHKLSTPLGLDLLSFILLSRYLDLLPLFLGETQSFEDMVIKRRTLSSGWDPVEGTWIVDWGWNIIDESGTHQVHDRQKLKSYTFDYLRNKLQETGFMDIKRVENLRLLIKAKRSLARKIVMTVWLVC